MRSFHRDTAPIVTFSPHLQTADDLAAYWLRQVTVRLRREICWRPREPAGLADRLSDSLGMQRFWEEKQAFFHSDPTAKYLSDQLREARPPQGAKGRTQRGSFSWVIRRLKLDDAATFVLALALTAVFDSAAGSVLAACLNDPMKHYPTLALAQKLWDAPERILTLADPAHPLFRFGLLGPPLQTSATDSISFVDWESPVSVPALVANQLLFPGSPLPPALPPLTPVADTAGDGELILDPRQAGALLHRGRNNGLAIVPVFGPGGSAHLETVRAWAQYTGQEVVACNYLPGIHENNDYLKTIATLCWLRERSLYLGQEAAPLLAQPGGQTQHRYSPLWLSIQSIPITIYLSITHRSQLGSIPPHLLQPQIKTAPLSFRQRRALWQKLLGPKADGLQSVISECSRRFRYEQETLRRIADGLGRLTGSISAKDLIAACRSHLELDMGELAQPVAPRFKGENLILPPRQHRQFREIVKAMQSLTEVHYEWGTGRAWNENGISVLFAGSPGTGKTMAAEILALELDLPIFRIDLSQVVNKYIGETEKNLKRLFDAADISDTILFFDEADSLFGRRTEVKDAHDRYANLEISYLLERMERFKGLAILATNRKKDLDEAFLRRLRYIIDFPFPGTEERKSIWRQVIPPTVDHSGIDIAFMARQFQLTGGHIRSIVLNACLQAASSKPATSPEGKVAPVVKETFKGVLTMEHVIAAIKREYDKMGQSVSLEHFGPYAGIVEQMEKNEG